MKNELDDKISQTLQGQAKELDALVDGGLFEYLKHGFDNSFAGVMKLGYAIAIVLSIVMFWLGYKFFTVGPEEQVFWGVLLIMSLIAQVATKLWIFMQTNRNILSRELRMLELRLLAQK
ncbi:hypothetical protein QTP81_01055 [Alteromonas sp. ASW11-36]|uniref:Phage holin family protein n=1 Tax=Alteromonas arenosi TaxID=3055817 RepID=A0ABT7SSR0_9ALTE|nr:DUF6768 family protein [Alteromonas sp. ASW11-36]MDM7859191.1 hypothetical protein [Alteromonas sp. ASW11-36]